MKNTLLGLALVLSLLAAGLGLYNSGATSALKSQLQSWEKGLGGTSSEAFSLPSLIFTDDGRNDLHTLTLGAGATTTSYTNTNGYTEFVKLAAVNTTGTASSSFDYRLFATSTAVVANSHSFTDLAPAAAKTILSGTLATSSAATSTATTRIDSIMVRSDGLVEVKAGESVLFALQKGDQTCLSLPAINGCEAATSSNRGFNLTALFETFSTSTTVR